MQSGLRALLKQTPDLVLLDMNLPTYDITSEESGGRLQAFAGREILRQLARRNIFVPVVVVTQFDYLGEGRNRIALGELDQELSARFPSSYAGYVYYQATQDDWMSKLAGLIGGVLMKTHDTKDSRNG